jgi:hypothetical protein
MSEKQSIIKLGIDTYKNRPTGNFSKEDNLKVMREALVDLNGGTALNYKTMRNNAKAIEMFEIIEEILNVTVMGGLEDNPFFQQFVETRNLKLGDDQTFFIEDNSIFSVAEIAAGINNIRRQRISGGTTVSVPTKLFAISIYEELNRVLSGRVSFTEMIDKVALSFDRDFSTKIYNALYNNFASLDSAFTVNGAYSESQMMDIIAHTEAATGKSVVMLGTKAALRNVGMAVVSDSMKEAYSNLGYYGKFYDTPMMVIKQNHTPGTYTFQLSDKDIYLMPIPTKPIKAVFEGENYIAQNDALNDDAFQMEYKYFMAYGLGVLLNEQYAHYRLP